MAACALLIEHARRRGSATPLIWAVPLIALWSNLHVESLLGVLFVLLFAAAEAVRPVALANRREALRALAIGAACVVATMANPYGWGLARYLAENRHVPEFLAIAELRPAYLPNYRAFFLYLGVGSALLLWRARTTALWEVVVTIVFAALGVKYLRFTPLVFLATAPILAQRLGWLMARGIDGRAVVVTMLAAGIVTARQPLAAFARFEVGTRAMAPPEFFPPNFAQLVRNAGLHGPVFNSMNLGGFIAWELYPEAQIYQDDAAAGRAIAALPLDPESVTEQ